MAIKDKPAEVRRPKQAPSKIARVTALLQRKTGATIQQLEDETGWQVHTVRAALTGLRKKGHSIERIAKDKISTYRITKNAA